MAPALPLPHEPAPSPNAEDLARTLLPTVLAWCQRLGGRGVDAEEATQDAVLLTVRRAHTRDPSVPIEAFAWGITRRVLANHRRRAWWRRWVGAPEDHPGESPISGLEGRDVARRVARLLDELPVLHREVLVLCDVEGRTSVEVAALLEVPDATVRSRLRLARERFRALAPRFHLSPPEGAS